MNDALLSPEAFETRLREQGGRRYHDRHDFNLRMHLGLLSRAEIQGWVLNRYYYQTLIPVKDALILSKSRDPRFRRSWMKRIVDHDGRKDGEGGLASWLRLAEGAGLDRAEVESLESVLPEVRKVCDAYVALVQERSLVEAVAASLTEFFAPDLMAKRLAAWKKYYPWVDHQALDYFERRVRQARKDSGEALQFVLRGAGTRALQDACIRALVDKCTILWSMLDAISTHYRE